jgi:hypothetical protein
MRIYPIEFASCPFADVLSIGAAEYITFLVKCQVGGQDQMNCDIAGWSIADNQPDGSGFG